MMGLCAAVLMVSSAVFASDVVVTKRGKKYHLPTCALIQGKKAAVMDEQQAVARGLKPCPKCFPDKVSTNKEDRPDPGAAGAAPAEKKDEKKK